MTDNWTGGTASWTSANWSAGVPNASTDALVDNGGDPLVTAPISVKSITIGRTSAVDFQSAGSTSSIGSFVYNSGRLTLDAGFGQGGSRLHMSGKLTNTGTLSIGNGGLSASDAVNAATLLNTGSLSITGNTTSGSANAAALTIGSGAAGFGTAGILTGSVALTGNALLQFASGQIARIASGAQLSLNGPKARIADASDTATNSALTGLTKVAGTFFLRNGAQVGPSGNLTVTGSLQADTFYGDGGATLAVGATLTNSGSLSIGNGGLASNTTVSAQALVNDGSLSVTGNTAASTTAQATLNVAGAAGFGTAGALTGSVSLYGDSAIVFGSGQVGRVASGASLSLNGNARIADSGSTAVNSALTGLTTNAGAFSLRNGAKVGPTGSLNNSGSLQLDNYYGDGGASLSIGESLTNGGTLNIGNGGLSSNTTVSAKSLINNGSLSVTGNTSANTTAQATLSIAGAAGFGIAGALTGSVSLVGDSAVTFGSGQIGRIIAGASLSLNGNTRIATTATPATNSALTGLTTNAGTFSIRNGAKVGPTGNLNNSASLQLDTYYGDGGATLAVGATLTNSGTLAIGNGGLATTTTVSAKALVNDGALSVTGNTASGTTAQATLSVAGAAGFGTAGILTGSVSLYGDSAIVFGSGQIGRVASGATLSLNGSTARIADSGSTATNSALTGLTTNAGTFFLRNGAGVGPTGNLNNSGSLQVDTFYGDGGATLAVGATLTNGGTLNIGNGGLSSKTTVSAKAIVNNGSLSVAGNTSANTTNQATLSIAGAAGFGIAGALTGSVSLVGDSAVTFGSGQIGRIIAGATLSLNGNARIATTASPATNSALAGLTTNAGAFFIRNGAKVGPTGSLNNSASLQLDNYYGDGGATLAVGATLTNSGTLAIGNGGLATTTTVSAKALVNDGALSVTGNTAANTTAQATLNVAGAAGFGTAGVLTGSVSLYGDSAIVFGSGQIGRVASGATLSLNGSTARIADSGSTANNSALTGLTTNAGTFFLRNGASAGPTGGFNNAGSLQLDNFYGDGGATLAVGATLTNGGTLNIGNGGLSSDTTVSALALDNDGAISLTGSASHTALLHIGGDTTGTGSDYVGAGATLQFDGAVAATQNVDLGGGDLILKDAPDFDATIENFSTGDTIDLTTFSGATLSFAENAGNTGGVLTVTGGGSSAALTFAGQYTTSDFHAAASGGGTLITHA